MAKKTFLQGLASEVERSAAIHTQHGLRLSTVLYESPAKFHFNSLNDEFFHDEQSEYVEQLTSDIRERGILVPIIAKPDGTLLAGHNRVRIAQELKLSLVPVQYVEQKLSPEEERKFVINDNLLRRHLSQQQRLALYRVLYPNFDERVSNRIHHRPQQNKVDIVHLTSDSTNKPLTAAIIAHDTGQSVSAVQKQLQRIKGEGKEKLGKQKSVTSKSSLQDTTPKKHTGIDTKLLKKVETVLTSAKEANEVTQKEVMKTLKAFMKQR